MRSKFVLGRPTSTGSPSRTTQLSASQLVSGSVPGGTNLVLISVEEDDVRFTWDGTAPTASVGLRLIKDQQPLAWDGPNGSMAFIGESGSGYVNLGWFKV